MSNTFKVSAAVLGIAVAAGALYWIVSAGSANQRAPEEAAGVSNLPAAANAKADIAPTKMPPNDWSQLIAASMKQRCPIEGMTKQQVEQAFGKPASITASPGNREVWKYEQNIEGDCIRNEVAKCVEHLGIHQESIYYFSPSGHLIYPSQDEVFHFNCVAEPFYSRYFKPLQPR